MSVAPPRTATSLPQNGGNRVIRAATRRRHAASQLLMLHPQRARLETNAGHMAPAGAQLRCRWAEAGHSRALKRRRSPTSTPGTAGVEGMRDKRGLAVGLGGGARGRRGLDGMCTAMKSPTGVEGAGGAGGLGRASRSTTPSRRFTHGRNREARVARGAGPRCRWAAAGLGRASRSTTPSRRLACGDLAGGPPPTGTNTQAQTLSHKRIGTTKPPGPTGDRAAHTSGR